MRRRPIGLPSGPHRPDGVNGPPPIQLWRPVTLANVGLSSHPPPTPFRVPAGYARLVALSRLLTVDSDPPEARPAQLTDPLTIDAAVEDILPAWPPGCPTGQPYRHSTPKPLGAASGRFRPHARSAGLSRLRIQPRPPSHPPGPEGNKPTWLVTAGGPPNAPSVTRPPQPTRCGCLRRPWRC